VKHQTSQAAEARRGQPGAGRMLLDYVRGRHEHVTLQPGRGRTVAGWLDERLDGVTFRGRLLRLAVQPTRNIPVGVIMSLEPPDHGEGWLSGPDQVMDAIATTRERDRTGGQAGLAAARTTPERIWEAGDFEAG
jgi:hypothetical protein